MFIKNKLINQDYNIKGIILKINHGHVFKTKYKAQPKIKTKQRETYKKVVKKNDFLNILKMFRKF